MFFLAFIAGATAIFGMSYLFLGTDILALAVTCAIAMVYAIGVIELVQFHKATQNLHLALKNVPRFSESESEIDANHVLADWLDSLHASLKYAVHSRIEGESKGLPSPVLTPYLVGLLVMLGLLGTFVGMVDTLQGSVIALQGSTELSAIREGLAAPIKGLGAAFGTSVAGVAASAMLGLMSTLSRRERILVARELDAKINTVFRRFSLNFNRQETYKSLQQQAKALPELAAQITVMAENLEKMGQRLGQELNTKQDKFHQGVEDAYRTLAQSVSQSLNQVLQNSGELVAKEMSPVVNQLMTDMSDSIQENVRETQTILVSQNNLYLDNVASKLKEHTLSANESLQAGLKEHERIQLSMSSTMNDSLNQFKEQFQSLSSSYVENFTRQIESKDKQRQEVDEAKLVRWTEVLQDSQEHVKQVLEAISQEQQKAWQTASSAFLTSSGQVSNDLNNVLQAHENSQQKASDLIASTLIELRTHALDASQGIKLQVDALIETSEKSLQSREQAETAWQNQHREAMVAIATQLNQQLTALREQEQVRSDQAIQSLSQLETKVAAQLADLGQALEAPMSRLIETASQAPKAAAEVISKLKQEMTQNMARDNDLLDERRRIMSDLDGLSDSLAQSTVNQGKAMEAMLSSSGSMLAEISERFDSRVDKEVNKLSDIASHFSESSIDIASMSDAFVGAIERFSQSNDKLVENLAKIELALESASSRSDEQLAYYVAQAREIIDHSMMSQKGLIEEINQLAVKRAEEHSGAGA